MYYKITFHGLIARSAPATPTTSFTFNIRRIACHNKSYIGKILD